MTRFVDVPALGRLVNRVGAGRFMSGIAAAMREDFLRWESFEKSARLGVDQLRIFDIDGSAMEKLAHNLARIAGLNITPADYSALRYVYELAMAFDEGEDIELVPDLKDPRDLFGMTEVRTG